MRRAALATIVLLAATGCANAPAQTPGTAPAAAPAATTTAAPGPAERYLSELERRGVSSTMTDTQLTQVGQAVCGFIPLMDRQTAISTIAFQSTNGNTEAAQAIVDSAQTQLCPDAEYAPAPAPAPTPEPQPQVSAGVANAIDSARSYLDVAGFSRQRLIEQLEYEGYSADEATEAVDSLDVDYNAEAVESARSYLDVSSFSRSRLVEQLEYEGYTAEQAEYGVSQTYG